MNDYIKLFRGQDRLLMHKIWQHAKENTLDQLSEEEQMMGKVMLEHEEYHLFFEFADELVDFEFNAETDVNPYLHVIIHTIVENQLKTKEPIEAYQFYIAMQKKKMPRHDIIHLIGLVMTPFILHTFKANKPFDVELYTRLLRKYKNMKPDKFYSAIDRDLDFVFKD